MIDFFQGKLKEVLWKQLSYEIHYQGIARSFDMNFPMQTGQTALAFFELLAGGPANTGCGGDQVLYFEGIQIANHQLVKKLLQNLDVLFQNAVARVFFKANRNKFHAKQWVIKLIFRGLQDHSA